MERSLKILVCALGRHPGDKLVQVAASATLFYIVKSEEAKPHLGRRIKELIVSRLLDAMQAFRFDQTVSFCYNKSFYLQTFINIDASKWMFKSHTFSHTG